jgi:hypothetical protein
MKIVNQIGQWIENNAIPLAVGMAFGMFIVLVRIS